MHRILNNECRNGVFSRVFGELLRLEMEMQERIRQASCIYIVNTSLVCHTRYGLPYKIWHRITTKEKPSPCERGLSLFACAVAYAIEASFLNLSMLSLALPCGCATQSERPVDLTKRESLSEPHRTHCPHCNLICPRRTACCVALSQRLIVGRYFI